MTDPIDTVTEIVREKVGVDPVSVRDDMEEYGWSELVYRPDDDEAVFRAAEDAHNALPTQWSASPTTKGDGRVFIHIEEE